MRPSNYRKFTASTRNFYNAHCRSFNDPPYAPAAAPNRLERELQRISSRQEDSMARRKPLDPDRFPADDTDGTFKGHDARSLGPSDSSDSGADLIGPGLLDEDLLGLDRGTNQDSEAGRLDTADAGASIGDLGLDATSDRVGTGEHLTAGKDPDVRIAADIAPDRIVGPEEAGLGGGLDQAEEARLGITDEEIGDLLGEPEDPIAE